MRRLALLCLGLLYGCAALSDDLRRAEAEYEQSRYEETSTWLEDLEGSTPAMDLDMRAKFYFLRGMSALRLNDRDTALYYLSLARETAGDHGEGLRPEWRQAMQRSLEELTPTEYGTFRARAPAFSADDESAFSAGGPSTRN